MRKITRFRDRWLFSRENIEGAEKSNFDDSNWEQVKVPHDWAAKGPFSQENDAQYTMIVQDGETVKSHQYGRTGGLPHTGKGVYRRRFKLEKSEKGQSVRLEFDGAMSHAAIYVNGAYAGGRPYGYSSFQVDITPFVKFGEENLLAVTLDNPPASSRWYPGAGLYRDVRLVTLPSCHIVPWGVRIRTEKISGNDAEISVEVTTSQEADGFRYHLAGPDGSEALAGNSEKALTRFTVKNYAAWDLEKPNLYTLTVTLKSGDTLSQRFGIRDVRFDMNEGMFLNGKKIRMNGVCLHHDLGPLGAAFNTAAAKRQLLKLRGIGVNAIRTTHNPAAPQFLDLCDEMGFLVIGESFDVWKIEKNANDYHIHFDEWAERDLGDMILRDRNHPSIVMWSIGNEICEQLDKEQGVPLAKMLCSCVRKLDSRPTTAGLNYIESLFGDVLDIPGYNYKPHFYAAAREKFNKPVYGAETASTVSSRGIYRFPIETANRSFKEPQVWLDRQVPSFDLLFPPWASTPDHEFSFQDECKQWILGEFVWTGFDYLGEPTPYKSHWPSHASYFGIFDLVGLPKDRAWLYESRWTNHKVLHLLPHWNFPMRGGMVTPVHCYTSFQDVELFLNGKSLGRKQKDSAYRIVWDDVIYEPGELKAVAYSSDGSVAMETFRRTTGAPAKLKLDVENSAIQGDGEDMAFVTISVCDMDGNLHPTASDCVGIRLEGPAEIAGIGNGDSASLETFQQDHIHVFNGQAVVYIRSIEGKTGTVKIHADGCCLLPAEARIKVI